MCAYKRAVRSFCVFLWSCRAPPTCCATLWESARDGSSFHFQSLPLCLLLFWHSFHNSCPVFFSPSLPHPRSNLPPKCQKCSVRRIPYVPYESVLLLLSNWQAKDFIRRVNLCYAVAVRCGRLCWRNTSPPPPSLCMSLAAQTWSVKCIVHRWELIICFLLFWFFLKLCFPLCGAFTAQLCSDLTALMSLSLHLCGSVLPDWWKSMKHVICEVLMNGCYYPSRKEEEIAFIVNGTVLTMGGWQVVAAPPSWCRLCETCAHFFISLRWVLRDHISTYPRTD